MKAFKLYVCVFVIVCPFVVFAQDEDYRSFEHEMLRNLTHWDKYKMYIPPDNGDVEDGQFIKFQLRLELMEELDEKKQQLTSLIRIWVDWIDMRLAWNASDFGGITELVTQDRRIWTPEIRLVNLVADTRTHNWPTVVMHNTGEMYFVQQLRYQTTCPLDFRKFPFDEQKCNLYFTQRQYLSRYKTQMNLTLIEWSQEENLRGLTENAAWQLTGISTKTYQQRNANQTRQILKYKFNLKRRGHYYSYMFVSPAVMLALLIPVLFLMPTEGTVRFSLGGALLISICVLLFMLEEELPITHTSIPAIGLYYTVTFVLVTLSLVLGTLTHNISSKSVRLSQPPYILKKMLLSCVARLLCVPYDSKYGVGTTDVGLEESGKQGSEETDPQTEWKLMAMVLDRILFLIFLIVVTITSFALLA